MSDYSNTVAIIPSTLHPMVEFWRISGTVMLTLLPQKSPVLSISGMIPVIAEKYIDSIVIKQQIGSHELITDQ